VLKETDKLANQLASKLGGVKLRYKSHYTTTSLEAMNAFSKASSFGKQGRDQEAIQEYLRAIQKDPRFGLAYNGLAVVYYNLGQEQKAIEYFKMAMMHLDRITEVEKNEIRSNYYLITRNYKKAIESFRGILKEAPREGWARMNLAFAYFFARDMKKAVEEGKKGIELDPKNLDSRYNLVWYAMGAGDFELADKEARTLLNQNPEFLNGYVCFALLELIQGHTVQANEAYQKLKSLSSHGSSYANIGIADLAIYEGRLADAKQILEGGIAKDIKNGSTDFAAEKLIMLAQTFLLQGKKALAIDTVDRAIDLSKKVSVMFSATKTFIDAGQGKRATALSEYLAEQIYPEYQAYAKLIEAEVKRSRNEIPGAIRLIEEAKTLVDTWLGRFALGCAYLEAGAFAEAHEELELCIKRRGEAAAVFFDDIPSCRYIPPVYYYLARAQEGMNSTAATESYQKFLKIKENADPGIAEVEDAKKRLAGLQE
jgi:tetratricopeptide (TPR) repeat protein